MCPIRSFSSNFKIYIIQLRIDCVVFKIYIIVWFDGIKMVMVVYNYVTLLDSTHLNTLYIGIRALISNHQLPTVIPSKL